jgi:DNA polymerase zeta
LFAFTACSAEIASAVTAANPRPVTLKLEKVYHPCILQTKKRYVGFAYESPEQQVPVFDAKGIETVRCAAAADDAFVVVVCNLRK